MQISGLSGGNSWYQPLVADASAPKAHKPPLAGLQLTDLDTSGDGSISEAELKTAMEKNAPAGADMSKVDQIADKLFKKMDTDGDGQVSATEFGLFQQQVASGHHHHHHHARPADSDDNDSNTVQSLVNSLFNTADANSDGVISKDEMTALLQKYQSASQTGSSGTQADPSSVTISMML